MTKPTGKLAFAYQTIAALEAKIKELESRQLQQDVEEFIAAHLREDPVTIDQYIDVDDLRDWMAGHVRVPVEPSIGLLVSMAMRRNLSFGLMPRDQQEALISNMRQIYEEVSGAGLYRKDREDEYKSMLNASKGAVHDS